ncbi:TPA: hypothetical protein QDZ34_000412 [Stenotrophomonas maltophilia]|nr:hypothetical protein [Stenotrophomonas maltophilia]HDS1024253.1 hypothetical protein [Stenotrophomonas maltophilia]HDS1028721.1 hypothetical protein [Stenotrophomonas maltophilia]HDS1033109.1 hypothetical protein [Stenotrophomonas maltophilia]
MDLPSGRYRILAYREFHDVPRLMHVADGASQHWILDCPFDDARDAYPQVYRVYPVHADAEGTVHALEQHTPERRPMSGSLPVDRLQFDETHRAWFDLP